MSSSPTPDPDDLTKDEPSADAGGHGGPADIWDDPGSAPLPRKRRPDELPAGAREARKDEDKEKGVEIGVKIVGEPVVREVDGQVRKLEVHDHAVKLKPADREALPRLVPARGSATAAEAQSADAPPPPAPMAMGQDPERWGEEGKKPRSIRWMITFGAIFAVAMILIAVFLPKMRWRAKGERDVISAYKKMQLEDNELLEPKDDNTLPVGVEEAAKNLGRAFMTAKSAEEILPLVRDSARVAPEIRARWTPSGVPATWLVPDESQWSIQKIGSREFGLLEGNLPDRIFRLFFVTQGGKTVIDWEATTAYCETPFPDIAKGEGNGGITRAYISLGDYYTLAYPEGRYQCFRIVSPGAEFAGWGYTDRGSAADEAVSNLFRAILQDMLPEYPVTLRLEKGLPDGGKNQWLISEMLHIDWLTP